MSFYPDIKGHISPSALDSWYNSKSAFIKSYFANQKTPDSAAMRSGKKIHALIEGGLLKVQHAYEFNEVVVTEDIIGVKMMYKVLGIPDSYGIIERKSILDKRVAVFVDYKSGKENTWDSKRLAADLKMKTTAWLVWQATGLPEKVIGSIEYIPTVWNEETREIEPTGGESEVAGQIEYSHDELMEFTDFIVKTMDNVNEEYEAWLKSTDEFINQDDVAAYAELDKKQKELEVEMGIILERIQDQMEFGGKRSLSTDFGTFSLRETKKFKYPADLPVNRGDGKIVSLEEAEAYAAGIAAAKKNFELNNEPISLSKSLSFRAKKEKNG